MVVGYLRLNATRNKLRNMSVEVPKGVLTCVTGVAGSGKSSLAAEFINNIGDGGGRVVFVDQKPVGRSSRSNPATYIGIFDAIRQAFVMPTGSARPSSAATREAPAPNVAAKAMSRWNSPSSTMSGSSAPCAGRGTTAMKSSNTATTT